MDIKRNDARNVKDKEKLTPIYDNAEKDSIWNKIRTRNKVSFESILNSFVNFENLEAKSVVKNPLAITKLHTWATYLKDEGFIEASNYIFGFIEYFLKIMYSASGRVDKILRSMESWSVKAEGMKDMKGLNKMVSRMRE